MSALSSNARIRIGLGYLATSAAPLFAIDNFYAGKACPNHCSGYGRCLNGQCTCEAGFTSVDCSLPIGAQSLRTSIQEDFESGSLSSSIWSIVQGGLDVPFSSLLVMLLCFLTFMTSLLNSGFTTCLLGLWKCVLVWHPPDSSPC